MFLRIGVLVFILLLPLAAAPVEADGILGGECGKLTIGTHRNPNLRIDVWITSVEWGPNGFKVGDEYLGGPGNPFGPWGPFGPNGPLNPVSPHISNVTKAISNESLGSPPSHPLPVPDLDPVKDALLGLVEQIAPDLLQTLDRPTIHMEIRIPPQHPDHAPNGQRVSFILDLDDCVSAGS